MERGAGPGSTLDLPVDFVEELGATQLFYGALGGAAFVVQVPTDEVARDIQRLPLRIAPDRVHIFDRETGDRLGRDVHAMEPA